MRRIRAINKETKEEQIINLMDDDDPEDIGIRLEGRFNFELMPEGNVREVDEIAYCEATRQGLKK